MLEKIVQLAAVGLVILFIGWFVVVMYETGSSILIIPIIIVSGITGAFLFYWFIPRRSV